LAVVDHVNKYSPYWSTNAATLARTIFSPSNDDLRPVQTRDILAGGRSCQFSETLQMFTPATQPTNRPFPQSWRCDVGDQNEASLKRSKDDVANGVRKVAIKIPLFFTAAQLPAIKSLEGAARFTYNSAKAFSDDAGSQARRDAIAALEDGWDPDDGCRATVPANACGKLRCVHGTTAHGCMTKAQFEAGRYGCWAMTTSHRACDAPVQDVDAEPGNTTRYLCSTHKNGLPGIRKTVTNPNPRLEAVENNLGPRCQKAGCQNLVVPTHMAPLGDTDRYWCDVHAPKLKYRVPAPRFVDTSQTLRDAVVLRASEIDPHGPSAWMLDVPYDVRAYAVKDFARDTKSYRAKKANGDTRACKPGFRSKRSRTWSVSVPASSIKFVARGRVTIFARVFANLMRKAKISRDGDEPTSAPKPGVRMASRAAKRLRRVLDGGGKMCDATIMKDSRGKYHLNVPVEIEVCVPKEAREEYQVALDCGGRTFQSFYSPGGVCGHIGHDFYAGLMPRLLRADKCMSMAMASSGTTRGRRRRRLLARAQANRTKVRNIVRDLHRKTCRFLCDNFGTIFVTKLDNAATYRRGRQINNKAVRNLMTFANAEFIETLKVYAASRDVAVLHVAEGCTTQTCPECGRRERQGSRRTRTCPCGFRGNRDIYASKGIFLRVASS
jgi:transposase